MLTFPLFFVKIVCALAYVHIFHYLCGLFRNMRNVRIHTGTQKEYAKHQKYSNNRTR